MGGERGVEVMQPEREYEERKEDEDEEDEEDEKVENEERAGDAERERERASVGNFIATISKKWKAAFSFVSCVHHDMSVCVNSTLWLKIEHLFPIVPLNQCMGAYRPRLTLKKGSMSDCATLCGILKLQAIPQNILHPLGAGLWVNDL